MPTTPTPTAFEFPEFDPETLPAKPADWSPTWERWHSALHGTRREKARAEHWERQAKAAVEALEKATAAHGTEIASYRERVEQAEIRAIPGLVDPDLDIVRSRYQSAVADTPEAKRPTMAEWAKAQVEAAAEEPDKAPRWLRGYLGDAQHQEQPEQAPPDARPPRDTGRKPPPPPKTGFTPDEIANMTPAQYKAHKEAGNIRLDGVGIRR